MNIMKTSLRTLSVAILSLGLVLGGGGLAHAYPRSAYPGPVMKYVAHPPGFPDSRDVIKRGSSLTCKVPLGTATQGDVSVRVRKDLVPLVRELMRQTEAKYRYNLRPGDTGGYNCRFIAGTTTPSNHAYGRAIDINWKSNPRSSKFTSNLPPKVVSLWIRHGFYWGGHYRTTPDTMHFEYVGARGNIDKYYRAAVKERGGSTPPPSPTCPSATLRSYPTVKQGSSGTAVKVVQCKLRTSGASLRADGVFGPATKSAVVKFQKSRGLGVDGVVGPRTWTALLAQGSSPTLRQGAKGKDVTRLQQALRASGQKLAV
ncbi:MAG: M15 family metallopeptidase, partial [Microlunatus sp.]|nr:M15 family metallopeptidase [Microlunatus sp.]